MFTNPDLERHVGKVYGKYSGEVINNQDPELLGRITVRVPSIFGATQAVLARPCLPYGHFFIPPVGAKVWVEFEAGDLNYPLWVGTWYPEGTTPAEAALDPPDSRVIQTASGHTIQLFDQADEEKIVIRHKGNSFISIDKHGSVIISNQKGSHIFLNAEDEEATFMEQHGNLVTMTANGVLIVNQDGATIEMKGDTINLVAPNVVLASQSVALGSGAAEPTIMGTAFKAMWDVFIMHTHPTAMGPSGPPVPPGLPLQPGMTLTSAVTVK